MPSAMMTQASEEVRVEVMSRYFSPMLTPRLFPRAAAPSFSSPFQARHNVLRPELVLSPCAMALAPFACPKGGGVRMEVCQSASLSAIRRQQQQ